jgi:type III restriction enzyme
MFFERILSGSRQWLDNSISPAKEMISYIQNEGKLRDAQIEAIQVYLYLKMECDGKPLHELFSEGKFLGNWDLEAKPLTQQSRNWLEADLAARMLYELSLEEENNRPILPGLKEKILENPESINAKEFFRKVFYNLDYADYLFSLPMGAGKTFLMATFIYIDLYFSELEPENPVWARNFLILIPSGLKSSIVPSLRSIEDFDPTWVLPNPTASNLRKKIQFEILDETKSSKKSNRTENPNVAKILSHQPFEDLSGLVMVVNAEKVILDKVRDISLPLNQSEDEEEKQANELRHLIGAIPRKLLMIDEVHHATDSDIKLRQVVSGWQKEKKNPDDSLKESAVVSVLGFSGTPYLASAEKIDFTDDWMIQSKEISNTVYYYPLVKGIGNYLKKPTIGVSSENNPLSIIKRGIEDFQSKYNDLVYADGTIPKIAIYCGKIDRLEEEIYPYLVGTLKIPSDEILRFHKGNKNHKLDSDAELDFRSLDYPHSKKRYILLVQVGKEGWSCRSLTGVILSNRGDCPANMVLQTSCRCLREVTSAKDETAIIWLNAENATVLERQLKVEQKTSIEEINRKQGSFSILQRNTISRLKHLHLPQLKFFQLQLRFDIETSDDSKDSNIKLKHLIDELDSFPYKSTAVVTKRLLGSQALSKEILNFTGEEYADCEEWIQSLLLESCNSLHRDTLMVEKNNLEAIFERITHVKDGDRFFNSRYNRSRIESAIRTAFYPTRKLKVIEETISKEVELLLAGKLKPVVESPSLFPNATEQESIVDLDREGSSAEKEIAELEAFRKKLQKEGMTVSQIERKVTPNPNYTNAVYSKDRTLHYLPYNFQQSNFEKEFLVQALGLTRFQDLEFYYNGEKYLTEFRVDCYEKQKAKGQWKKVGLYTPDFLVIRREKGEIAKVLIVETKGSGFAEQSTFIKRRNFVENTFLRINNEMFGYEKFSYLYLSDDKEMDENLTALTNKANEFFALPS